MTHFNATGATHAWTMRGNDLYQYSAASGNPTAFVTDSQTESPAASINLMLDGQTTQLDQPLIMFDSGFRFNFGRAGSLRVYGDGLEMPLNGEITAGVINNLSVTDLWGGASFYAYGMQAAASTFTSALLTTSRADDGIFYAQMFAGNDLIRLTAHSDAINAQGGRDLVQGGEGNDSLNGADGFDLLDGGSGADRLTGGTAGDLVLGGAGADRLLGQSGNDWLTGGRGTDTLTGGSGADRFLFRAGDGRDVISDFQDGSDKVVLSVAGLKFGQLTISQVGNDVRIRWGNQSIVLENEKRANISAADFQFDPEGLGITARKVDFFSGWDFIA
ncbi:calcium-binding protein [Neogemmobacter tilapiae]|uniref:Calcium-binding protein n=1 Tax=Neogemmobacter tilapiae TaxID=875041 RepID=A0A918TWL3_9RHOB|nr:hypothetical protein [Gemmobacter tilapiae]GHC66199.1 hypothetical protein GCM10007315_33690 [Gemmobacter tilapiae]